MEKTAPNDTARASTSKGLVCTEVGRLAGRLQHFIPEWEKITNSTFVLNNIRGYKIPFCARPKPKKTHNARSYSLTEKAILNKIIQDLLNKGALNCCKREKGEILSPFFLRQKPNGDFRFILNLKHLNKHINPPHFKLEDYRMVQNLIYKNCFMASLDLKDAYFLIPIVASHRKYLKFYFDKKIYEFTCLCFGLNIAPYIFTKIMKPVIHHLRLQGILLVIYLDDILIFGNTFQECHDNIFKTSKILETLGFVINFEKSQLIPSQQCKYLGFIFNSVEMSLSLPLVKSQHLQQMLRSCKNKKYCKIRDLAKLIGTLVSVCPAIPYGRFHIKLLERHKYHWLKKEGGDYGRFMLLPKELSCEFDWWIHTLNRKPKQYFKSKNFVIEIFTDASPTGWGAFANGERAHGFWSIKQSRKHINFLELVAAYYGLKCFAKNKFNCQILLRLDNTTAISNINRMGSVKYKHLNSITSKIWNWCEKRGIFIFASYINSYDNVEADEESRSTAIETEYSLNTTAFSDIKKQFGTPEVDLFASQLNAKCHTYFSWRQDPDSSGVDAFTISWTNIYFYAFPPFSLIPRVLNKIILEKATGILVVPYWPTQAWYPLFKKLVASNLIFLKPSKTLLLSPFREPHPMHTTLTLAVGKLCGKLSS